MNSTVTRRTNRREGLPSIFSMDPLSRMREEFDHMLSTWFTDNDASRMSSFSPSLDLNETENSYEVHVDLPGLQPNEINVQLSDNVLTIHGERKFEKTDEKEKGHKNGPKHVIERFHGTFSRSVMLPGAVKSDKIDANYKDGVLSISLPKAEGCKTCQINVKS
jgi:HSP20 family protein